MLPSTLDMVPSPSTWNPRPSTLDKKIDSLLLWGSCQGKLYCFQDISKIQTIKFPRGKLPREKLVTLKNQVSLGKLSTSRVYLGKKSVV